MQTAAAVCGGRGAKAGLDLLTKTPLMAKSDLYKISGHWDHYLDGMFVLGDPDDDTECLCPASHDLSVPVSGIPEPNAAPTGICLCGYDETSTLFRNEDQRRDARPDPRASVHHFRRPSDVHARISWRMNSRAVWSLANYMLKTLGLHEDVSYRFSQWDPE